MDEDDFADMVEHSPVNSVMLEYREPSVDGRRGKLIGACLTDRQADGLSMIYSFFAADEEDRRPGLGNFIIMDHIARARSAGPRLCLPRLLGAGIDADGVQDALPPDRGARPRRLAAVARGCRDPGGARPRLRGWGPIPRGGQ